MLGSNALQNALFVANMGPKFGLLVNGGSNELVAPNPYCFFNRLSDY
jgi:hypothetical protein